MSSGPGATLNINLVDTTREPSPGAGGTGSLAGPFVGGTPGSLPVRRPSAAEQAGAIAAGRAMALGAPIGGAGAAGGALGPGGASPLGGAANTAFSLAFLRQLTQPGGLSSSNFPGGVMVPTPPNIGGSRGFPTGPPIAPPLPGAGAAVSGAGGGSVGAAVAGGIGARAIIGGAGAGASAIGAGGIGGILSGLAKALGPTGLLLVGLTAFTLGLRKAVNGLDNLAERASRFSPVVARAKATANVNRIREDIRIAQSSGTELAELVAVQSEFSLEWRRFKDNVLFTLLPGMKGGLQILKGISSGMSELVAQGSDFGEAGINDLEFELGELFQGVGGS